MVIIDWLDCKKKRIAKEIKIDKNLITSLIKSSDNKLKSQSLLKLNKETASSKISLTYDTLRELLEALAISKGFKIYNHECYTYFLKEVLNESNLADKFNNLRKIRNDINYYGKEISPSEAEIVIFEIIDLIKKIRDKL